MCSITRWPEKRCERKFELNQQAVEGIVLQDHEHQRTQLCDQSLHRHASHQTCRNGIGSTHWNHSSTRRLTRGPGKPRRQIDFRIWSLEPYRAGSTEEWASKAPPTPTEPMRCSSTAVMPSESRPRPGSPEAGFWTPRADPGANSGSTASKLSEEAKSRARIYGAKPDAPLSLSLRAAPLRCRLHYRRIRTERRTHG